MEGIGNYEIVIPNEGIDPWDPLANVGKGLRTPQIERGRLCCRPLAPGNDAVPPPADWLQNLPKLLQGFVHIPASFEEGVGHALASKKTVHEP